MAAKGRGETMEAAAMAGEGGGGVGSIWGFLAPVSAPRTMGARARPEKGTKV
jgi:hypothetical protein